MAVSTSSEELAKAAVYALVDLVEDDNDPGVLLDVYNKSKFPAVRKAVIYSMEDLEGPAAVKALIQVLKTEKDVELRRAVIRTLGETGKDEVVPILLEIAQQDEDSRARKEAVMALGEIGTPKAKEALKKIIE
jgi:HEAT repeat protein